MNLLHLLPTLERRGAQMFARRLIAGLNGKGEVQQALAVLRPGGDEVGIGPLIPALRLLPPGGVVPKVLALRKWLASIQPDVILAHGGGPLKYAVLARAGAATPRIVYRKIGLTERWLGTRRWLKLPVQRWLVGQADAISTVGEATRREAITLFHADPARVRVIYNGYSLEHFACPAGTRERVRQSLGLSPATRVLIAVWALGWEKNQAAMLRVLAALRRARPNLVLLIAGEGPERARLDSLTDQLAVRDAVCFLGVRKDVPDLLAAADLCILTSLTEGVPGVLIEGGLAGLPCVSWDVAGAKEVVVHEATGLITPFQDEPALIAAVQRLLDDPALAARFGQAARQFCRDRFSIDTTLEAHFDLIRQICLEPS